MNRDKFKLDIWDRLSLPAVYDDSLSYYEVLNKVIHYLNRVIRDMSNTNYNFAILDDDMDSVQGLTDSNNEKLEEVRKDLNARIDDWVKEMIIGIDNGDVTAEVISQYDLTETQKTVEKNVDDFTVAISDLYDKLSDSQTDVNAKLEQFDQDVLNKMDIISNTIQTKIDQLQSDYNEKTYKLSAKVVNVNLLSNSTGGVTGNSYGTITGLLGRGQVVSLGATFVNDIWDTDKDITNEKVKVSAKFDFWFRNQENEIIQEISKTVNTESDTFYSDNNMIIIPILEGTSLTDFLMSVDMKKISATLYDENGTVIANSKKVDGAKPYIYFKLEKGVYCSPWVPSPTDTETSVTETTLEGLSNSITNLSKQYETLDTSFTEGNANLETATATLEPLPDKVATLEKILQTGSEDNAKWYHGFYSFSVTVDAGNDQARIAWMRELLPAVFGDDYKNIFVTTYVGTGNWASSYFSVTNQFFASPFITSSSNYDGNVTVYAIDMGGANPDGLNSYVNLRTAEKLTASSKFDGLLEVWAKAKN